MNTSNNFSFYQNLPTFSNFSQVSEENFFHVVPDDWTLVLSDIKGSTKAIQEGRYKEVNFIGAATITAFINVAKSTDVPFVFGGDGATLLVPDAIVPDLISELENLQDVSKNEFKLELRVGLISMATLNIRGQPLYLAKYQLSPGNYLAQFKGGALTYSENLMKSGSPEIKLLNGRRGETEFTPLEGLSCRLNPLKSTNGKILTLLCKPTAETREISATLSQVIGGLSQILNNDLKTASPVKPESLSWSIPPRSVDAEAKLTKSGPYWLRVMYTFFWALVSNMSLKFKFNMGAFNPVKYRSELELNSDFKKFDETLRMVLDCSNEQINLINLFLENLYQKQLIVYGTHLSDSALMTCIVQSPINNKHIHFIDGSDGGYAMAALQLKEQLKSVKIQKQSA